MFVYKTKDQDYEPNSRRILMHTLMDLIVYFGYLL